MRENGLIVRRQRRTHCRITREELESHVADDFNDLTVIDAGRTQRRDFGVVDVSVPVHQRVDKPEHGIGARIGCAAVARVSCWSFSDRSSH